MTTLVTPIGTAQYPWLHAADTKWHELGEYKVNLILDKEEADELMVQIDEAIAEKKKAEKVKKLAPSPYVMETDDNDDETGRVIFKCKNRNRINSKTGDVWDRKPMIVDAQAKPCSPEIGGGSKLRLKLELYPWANAALGAGVSLQIKAVQVIELEPIAKKEFDAIDGFEAEDNETIQKEEDSLF